MWLLKLSWRRHANHQATKQSRCNAPRKPERHRSWAVSIEDNAQSDGQDDDYQRLVVRGDSGCGQTLLKNRFHAACAVLLFRRRKARGIHGHRYTAAALRREQ